MLTASSDPIHFIYADDDRDDHEILSVVLTDCDFGCDFRSVYDGCELMSVLQNESRGRRLHFLIMDINMPKVDGFTAIGRIRSMRAFCDLPVYALTTSSNTDDKRKAMALGFNGFYTKPSKASALKKIIEEIAVHTLKFQTTLK